MTDEQTIFRGSPSILTRAMPVAFGVALLVAAVVGLMWFRDAEPWTFWLLLAAAAVAVLVLLYEVVVNNTTVYEVTTQRIRISRGMLTRRTEELELYRANDTSLIEPLAMRLFGLGTIEVRTMEEGLPNVQLTAVSGARRLREELRTHIETCRDRKRVRMAELDDVSHGDPEAFHSH